MEMVSFEYNWLHQKHTSIRQFNLTFCILFSTLSKALEFLSFHIAHHILTRKILHLYLYLGCFPTSSQLWIASVILVGLVHEIPLRFKNNLHSWSVNLHFRERWLTVSAFSPQKKHQEHNVISLLFKLSWVSTASMANNQTKHATSSRILDIQIPLHGQWLWGWLVWFKQLYAQPTLKLPFRLPFHHKMSWPPSSPLNCPMVLKKSATLWISQSFNCLLKMKFHPWESSDLL